MKICLQRSVSIYPTLDRPKCRVAFRKSITFFNVFQRGPIESVHCIRRVVVRPRRNRLSLKGRVAASGIAMEPHLCHQPTLNGKKILNLGSRSPLYFPQIFIIFKISIHSCKMNRPPAMIWNFQQFRHDYVNVSPKNNRSAPNNSCVLKMYILCTKMLQK